MSTARVPLHTLGHGAELHDNIANAREGDMKAARNTALRTVQHAIIDKWEDAQIRARKVLMGARTEAISLSILSTVSSSITVFAVIDRIAVASLLPSSANTILPSFFHKLGCYGLGVL